MKLLDSPIQKVCTSEGYSYVFRKSDGLFLRWGKTQADDPDYSPFGPEIADIEITTACNGVPGLNGVKSPCKFCYKSNGPTGHNMTLAQFKTILDKIPKTLTQAAFGADSEAVSNPDLWGMMAYCRSLGVIPNITVANISNETADKLATYCGAVAVSRYANKNVCYDSVKRLTDRGMKQINIHAMVSVETFDDVMETIKDRQADPRLAKLNAVVLLSLKQKGRGASFTPLPQNKFTELVNLAMQTGGIGLDSCSCPKFMEAVKNRPDFKQIQLAAEPCESTLFSVYIDSFGMMHPCSFAETEGIDVLNCNDFLKDVWFHPETVKFRDNLIQTAKRNSLGCRECPLYTI